MTTEAAHELAPVLKVTGLCKSFGGLQAATDFGVEIAPGKIVAVIGPNGAGKSTVFNMIAGESKADSGRIEFIGKDVTHWRAEQMARHGLARTFQSVRVLPGLSVNENMLVALSQFARASLPSILLRLRSFRREQKAFDERVNELLTLVGLQGHSDALASSLPYGRRKVLEFIMAIATEPKLLLLDEPAAGLNQTEKQELVTLIRGVNRTGVAVLLIEHDVAFVSSLADHLVVLNFGAIVASGVPSIVLKDPAVIEIYIGEGA